MSDINEKIKNDIDFINTKKYGNSLKKLKQTHDKAMPDKVIASLLNMSIDDVQALYKQVIQKIQDKLSK